MFFLKPLYFPYMNKTGGKKNWFRTYLGGIQVKMNREKAQ
ncbi:hypothetical protein DBT_1003 [Dissulfuribacter thermophilus]|uniref:Uncharacterized protein n=1 Tax=Dissulfuribacter thermophilus TaxID=1156395 RepID=A0A1B9F6V7_9BACT|nr:hypothetical protein DBT_1003 [Dissulfuribacter thermophilus]